MNRITLIKNCGNHFEGSMTLKRRDGRYVYANKRWLDFVALERREIIDKTDADLFNEDTARTIMEIDKRVWNETLPMEHISQISNDGVSMQVISYKWIVSPGDTPEPLLCSVTDALEKKDMVKAFVVRIEEIMGVGQSMSFTVQSFKKQKILFDYLSEGIFVVDEHNTVTFINKGCEKMFGYGPGEALGLNFEVFIPERFRQAYVAHRDRYATDHTPHPVHAGMDLWAVRKNGEEFAVEISVSPFHDAQGQFVIVFINDVTQRRQQETELRNAYTALEKHSKKLALMNEEIRDFAYVAAHHLQEPMRKLQLYGNMLQKSLKDRLMLKENENLDKVLNCAAIARQRLNDFQLFTRMYIEDPLKTPVSLNATIHDVIEELADLIEQEHANVTIANELPTVMGDPGLLKQLFQNLVSNALKFCKQGVLPEIHISAKKVPAGNDVTRQLLEIDVTDNGIGFNEEFSDKLFRMFQKIRSDTTGTGIGLAISRKICTLHGGDLTARGKEGAGATFMATLAV